MARINVSIWQELFTLFTTLRQDVTITRSFYCLFFQQITIILTVVESYYFGKDSLHKQTGFVFSGTVSSDKQTHKVVMCCHDTVYIEFAWSSWKGYQRISRTNFLFSSAVQAEMWNAQFFLKQFAALCPGGGVLPYKGYVSTCRLRSSVLK